jgi:cellulose 1,4-beta-cellobiosidase
MVLYMEALVGGLVTIPATMAHAVTQCDVAYTTSDWPGGFTANVTIRNLGDPVNGWTLGFTFPDGNQHVQQGWSATWSQNGRQVTAQSLSYNGSLGTGASTSIGFNGAWSGSNPKPTSFTLNGTVCNGGGGPTTPPPTTTPPPSTPPPTTPPPTSPPPGDRVDNPYLGVQGYVNPEWKAKANAEPGGSRVSSNPTAVWLDRIAAINGTPDSISNGSMSCALPNAPISGAWFSAQFRELMANAYPAL